MYSRVLKLPRVHVGSYMYIVVVHTEYPVCTSYITHDASTRADLYFDQLGERNQTRNLHTTPTRILYIQSMKLNTCSLTWNPVWLIQSRETRWREVSL